MTVDQRRRALSWTVAQYILLMLVALGGSIPLPSPASASSVAGWTLIFLSGAMTAWSLWSFRITKIHIAPLVRDGGTLVVAGPYRWIRHPMYLAVLLLSAGLVAIDPTWIRIGSAVLMLPVLVGKLTVEEELLQEAFPDYRAYAARTNRLIPGLW